MSKTKIEWSQQTWNPTTGCDKISAGCKNCYAEVMSYRLKAMGQEKYKDGFDVRTHPSALTLPYKWKKPRLVFVNSMSDLFHNEVPIDFIKEVFKIMNENSQHIFQVLTKRAERLLQLNDELNWTENIWMGVSVENDVVMDRIDFLRQTSAKVKFLSCEPLISPLNGLNLEGIHWVIVGGESGRNARPIDPEWVVDIQEKCQDQGVPFFFKQWGGSGKMKKANGRLLKDKTYSEMPVVVQPKVLF